MYETIFLMFLAIFCENLRKKNLNENLKSHFIINHYKNYLKIITKWMKFNKLSMLYWIKNC